jgi:hypothetical protein
LVSRTDVLDADLLIGLGLNDDWSFEKEFRDINPVPVIGYDGSVGSRRFLKAAVKEVFSFWSPYSPFHYLRTARKFDQFFSPPNVHFPEYVGMEIPGFVPMDEVFSRHPSRKIFLKIDIEGSEYRILESILRHQDRLAGMVFEFHDVDIHIHTILNFVQASSLKVVAVHGNNYGGVVKPGGLPRVLELSLSSTVKETARASRASFALQQPNNPNLEDFEISFVAT